MSEAILPISRLEILFSIFFLFFSHSTHFSHMSEAILPISHLLNALLFAFPRSEIGAAENFDRGFYAGPFGYVSSDGAEFCVAIRSALLRGFPPRSHTHIHPTPLYPPLPPLSIGRRDQRRRADREDARRAPQVFYFSTHPPISPICRTPLFPYLTFYSCFFHHLRPIQARGPARVLLAANKCESEARTELAAELWAMGIGEIPRFTPPPLP